MSAGLDAGEWIAQAKVLAPRAVAMRRDLHRHPEQGLHLPRTTAAVLESLRGLDVEIAEGASTSGLLVTLKGGQQGPTILLRGDMDALPLSEDTGLEFSSQSDGSMHACGHDMHTAMLSSAANILHSRRAELCGTVKFLFQPGEEGHFGALRMIEDGLLDRAPVPSAAFAIHISPNMPTGVVATRPGPLLASQDRLSIVIKGKGGHAGVPHLARDPIPVACELVGALQNITRRIDVYDPIVLTIGKITAGTADNVIPDTAELAGTLRAMSQPSREAAHKEIRRIANGLAATYDLTADVTIHDGYPPTVNDAAFTGVVREVTSNLFGTEKFLEMQHPVMGSEDFSYVLQKVPGCLVFLGAAPPGSVPAQAAACHSNKMVADEEAMAFGIALHAAIAKRFLAATR